MECPKCGCEVREGAAYCGSCGARLASGELESRGRLYLILSVLELLFCCWPAAIPALIYALRTRRYSSNGDIEAAERSARGARVWLIISAAAGLAAIAYFAFFSAVLGLEGHSGLLEAMTV